MGKVSFGWRIPEFPVDGSPAREFKNQVESALKVVQEGFDSAWLSDHPIPWADWQSPATANLEGWTTIAYLAPLFRKLTFGHIMICNSYRNPALMAKMAATLSFLTDGRFILGIGAGWKKDEYLSYGYDFPKPSERIAQLDEGVQIIKKMWRDDKVTFHGKYYHIDNAYCDPKPDPVPPIMIGGGGERLTMKLVASHADWWNCPNLTVDQYRHKLEVLQQHCHTVGRPYEEIRKVWLGEIAIAGTKEEAQKIAFSNPFVVNESRFDASTVTLIGTPEQVVDKLEAFRKMGVDYFIFRFLDFPRMSGTRLFVEKVINAR